MRRGMISFGFMGGVHFSAIQAIERESLTPTSSRIRLEADAGTRGNIPHVKSTVLPVDINWDDNWQELAEYESVDAVDICIPISLHKQVTLAALTRVKHVLCEKPTAWKHADCMHRMEAAS